MLGCIFDVHGNLPALEAVLADARSIGVERFVLGGDYAAFGAWPEECVAAVEALDAVVMIRGNWERWVSDLPDEVRGDAGLSAAAGAVRAALGDARVESYGRLPGGSRGWMARWSATRRRGATWTVSRRARRRVTTPVCWPA